MSNSTRHANPRTITVGVLLLASGLAINYLLERYNIFKVWETSRYPISWADLFYPPLCVLLSLTGAVLVVSGGISRLPIRPLLRRTTAIVIPLTVLYTLFAFAMQFIQTGADRLGECPGLDQAASSSNVIPPSKVRPGHAAVGCGVERRGILLSFYNDMSVYGVTDPEAQQRVLERVTEQYQQAHTHPVQVMFYEEENWSVRQGKSGVTFGSRGPEKLIRIASVG
jgi:hypothetical protein